MLEMHGRSTARSLGNRLPGGLRSIGMDPVSQALRVGAWWKYGRHHAAPLRPDRLLRIDPQEIIRKPARKPEPDRLPPAMVVDGNWDRELRLISEDVVAKTLRQRFLDGEGWETTGYVEYIRSPEAEHHLPSRERALQRCQHLDALYRDIAEHGYRSQRELARAGGDHAFPSKLRPAPYNEVAVNVTRDGEFVWHAGMHRLVIARLLEVPEIPVRVHTRHAIWQSLRDEVARHERDPDVNHPDLEIRS